jgi:hypothetical protein
LSFLFAHPEKDTIISSTPSGFRWLGLQSKMVHLLFHHKITGSGERLESAIGAEIDFSTTLIYHRDEISQ